MESFIATMGSWSLLIGVSIEEDSLTLIWRERDCLFIIAENLDMRGDGETIYLMDTERRSIQMVRGTLEILKKGLKTVLGLINGVMEKSIKESSERGTFGAKGKSKKTTV